MAELMNLHLFDGASGGDGGTAGETGEASTVPAAEETKSRKANSLENVRYGIQDDEPDTEPEDKAPGKEEKATPDRAAEFDALIKGDYKDEFSKRTQSIIDKRFKETKTLERQIEAQKPIFDMLASKYGVELKDGNYSDLLKAIEDDDSYYEDEAMQKGMSVEQLKAIKKMERKNEELRRTVEERNRQERAQQVYQKWIDEGEALKEIYPNFDFEAELQNQTFVDLIKRDIDVKTAYEVAHHNEQLGGAMQYTAQQVAKKVASSIASRSSRPQENGASSQPAITTKRDVNSLTRKDREEIERRVLRGEKIRF